MILILLACSSGSAPGTDSPGVTDDTAVVDCEAASCDDGLDCTQDECDPQGRCIHSPLETCEWPASLPPDVDALASLDEDFRISLSGAAWNAEERALWVVRGDGAQAWSLVEDGAGGWEIEDQASLGNRDVESVVIVDPVGAPKVLHVLIELRELVMAFDLSEPGVATELATWPTDDWLSASGTHGSEGMTFVPNEALEAWGFVDVEGQPRTGTLGYGGLFFIGTQNGGAINVFDLSNTKEEVELVGSYPTASEDTSGLEFDADTGRLYVWHGGDDNDLELMRLSSTDAGNGERRFDTEAIFDYPGDDNLEGFALTGIEDCGPNGRPFFFTIDDGGARALDRYPDWPLCSP